MAELRSDKASSEVAVRPEGPLKQQLSRGYNDMYEARALEDGDRVAELRSAVSGLLEWYCRDEAENDYERALMTGGFYSACGDYEEALTWERKGWELATARRELWISSFNIADELRRDGQLPEALEWARMALRLNAGHAFSYLNLALCLFAMGREREADEILDKLVSIADFSNARDALAARLEFERELDAIDAAAAKRLRAELHLAQETTHEDTEGAAV